MDILFVGGQEAIPPVRCALPSPLFRPLSRISRLFRSFDPPRACLCQPLPLHARASDGARAGTKVAPDPDLHAGAARAASRPRQGRRGRLGRGRLRTSRGGRPMVGRLGRAVLAGPRFASRVWQGSYVSGTGGGRRLDEQPAAEGGGGGVGGLVASADGGACGAAHRGREARAAAPRGQRRRGAAADAPPARARAARTAPAEPHSRGWPRARLFASSRSSSLLAGRLG